MLVSSKRSFSFLKEGEEGGRERRREEGGGREGGREEGKNGKRKEIGGRNEGKRGRRRMDKRKKSEGGERDQAGE